MSDHTDSSKGHYAFDLDVQVKTCIGEYEQDMKNWYSKGGPTDPELFTAIFQQAERFSKHVLKATKEMAPSQPADCALVEPELRRFIRQFESHLMAMASILEQKGLSPDGFLTALRGIASDTRPDDGTILKVVWEHLLAQSMWDAVDRSRKAATRLLLLFSLHVSTRRTERVSAFLRQVAQCFVWGGDVPCIVFSRSVIDVTLADAGFRKGNLKQRIDKMPAHMLDAEHKGYAHEVRKLGNDAIHDKPLAMQDVLEVIRKTLLVLEQLSQPDPGESVSGNH